MDNGINITQQQAYNMPGQLLALADGVQDVNNTAGLVNNTQPRVIVMPLVRLSYPTTSWPEKYYKMSDILLDATGIKYVFDGVEQAVLESKYERLPAHTKNRISDNSNLMELRQAIYDNNGCSIWRASKELVAKENIDSIVFMSFRPMKNYGDPYTYYVELYFSIEDYQGNSVHKYRVNKAAISKEEYDDELLLLKRVHHWIENTVEPEILDVVLDEEMDAPYTYSLKNQQASEQMVDQVRIATRDAVEAEYREKITNLNIQINSASAQITKLIEAQDYLFTLEQARKELEGEINKKIENTAGQTRDQVEEEYRDQIKELNKKVAEANVKVTTLETSQGELFTLQQAREELREEINMSVEEAQGQTKLILEADYKDQIGELSRKIDEANTKVTTLETTQEELFTLQQAREYLQEEISQKIDDRIAEELVKIPDIKDQEEYIALKGKYDNGEVSYNKLIEEKNVVEQEYSTTLANLKQEYLTNIEKAKSDTFETLSKEYNVAKQELIKEQDLAIASLNQEITALTEKNFQNQQTIQDKNSTISRLNEELKTIIEKMEQARNDAGISNEERQSWDVERIK